MAGVYAADRANGEFEREVAIKVARSDRPRRGMTALLQAERGVLARLRHPNICQFPDGGSMPQGEPNFVTERLTGAPLTSACQEQGLPWRVVIGHCLDLCAAVAHIHGQLIVHRDIKLDNVLMAVGPTGPIVKLLDVGIAGMLAHEVLAQDSHGMPGQSGNWYSPDYAAPEVVAGQVGGVAVDIQSLGCLLRDLAPLFPAARYASVEALAADLCCVRDRHLISLCRQAGYRLRCFVQRHTVGLGVAALALANLSLLQGQPQQAFSPASEAVSITGDPKAAAPALQPGALLGLAEAHAALGQPQQAKACLMEFQAASASRPWLRKVYSCTSLRCVGVAVNGGWGLPCGRSVLNANPTRRQNATARMLSPSVFLRVPREP